jgi:Uma2 family endonuclease
MTAAAILEIPEVRAQISQVSVAQYHRFPERNENGRPTELIRGIIIEKMSKSPLHASISDLLCDLLTPQLPEGFVIRRDNPLTFADSEPEPDVAIVRGTRREFLNAHPTTAALVIEVAVSSAALDRENASLFAEAGVEEYWIVLPRERQIEVYRAPNEGSYAERRVVETGATLTCGSVAGLQIALDELFG